MKRLISLFLSIALIVTFVPTAFAASAPPYSLIYLNGIAGVQYRRYQALENLVYDDFTVSQRTVEMYDAINLWLIQNASWSATVQPFRNAFIVAGFEESIDLDNYGQEEYSYIKKINANSYDVFIIRGEKASHAVLNEGALIFISHGCMTSSHNPSQPEKSDTITAQQAADALYNLGLFNGTGKDTNGNPIFDLDRAPTRHEAVTMLVRLLGKESEAKNGNWNMPFTDVADWAKPYVGYAYAHNLTSGTSFTTFSGQKTVSASEYITFVLRALGYESGTDFQWDRAWELSDRIGLTNGHYNANTTHFTRGDVAIISYQSLSISHKEQTSTPPSQPPTSTKGSLVFETIHCERAGTARVGIKDATARKWEACCSEILITDYDESDCYIYVMSTASTRKHHYVECTDTNGYKYICTVTVF